jgi:cysteine-rich repeat protein
MKSAKPLLGALILLTGLACGDGSTNSLVVVTVVATPNMAPVAQLRVIITNLSDAAVAKTDTQLFPEKASLTPLAFDASFALAFPKSRTGELDLEVDALDLAGNVAAIGSGKVTIAIGGRRDLTIYLFIPGAADAGAIDSGASEAGQPPLDTASTDAGPVVDASALDSRFGPDALASDAGGPDVPLSGDGGGLDGTGGTGGTGGQGGTGGTSSLDGAGGGGAGAGGSTLVGEVGNEAGGDVNNTGGSGGISSTGGTGGYDGGIDGAGGTGGISSTGGAGGTGGTSQADAGDADVADAAPTTCSTTVSCPTYPKCLIQPACDTATGLCSQPSQCSVCGNGLVDFSEECDDGNTINGDHCSSVCKWEYCGDGVVQSSTLAALSLIYLARSCVTVDQDIWMVLNGQEVARGIVQQTCDCQPGIVTIPVTNPTFLRLGNNGTNVVEVHTHAEISWAVVHWESPTGPGDAYPIDASGNGAAHSRLPNLCTNGSEMGMESGVQISLAGGEQCDHGAKNGTAGDTCNANCTVK